MLDKGIGNTKEVKTYRMATTIAHIGIFAIIVIIMLYNFNIINHVAAGITILISVLTTIGSIVVAQKVFRIICHN